MTQYICKKGGGAGLILIKLNNMIEEYFVQTDDVQDDTCMFVGGYLGFVWYS